MKTIQGSKPSGTGSENDRSETSGRSHSVIHLMAGPLGLGVVTAALVLFLVVTADGFASSFNLYNLGRDLGVWIVVGLSQMVVLGMGGLNLAVGAIGAASAMLVGWLLESLGMSLPLAVLVTVVFATSLGLINGLLVTWLRLHSFVVTLATASIITGLMLVTTKAEAFRELPSIVADLGRAKILPGVSVILVLGLVVAALVGYLYRFTTTGRSLLATGANPWSAKIAGLPVKWNVVRSHGLSGLLAGVAGILVVMRVGASLPSTGGEWVLDSFAIPIIGGTALAGGGVSSFGAVLGALILLLIRNGLLLVGIGGWWIQLLSGLALLAAVLLDRWRSRVAEAS